MIGIILSFLVDINETRIEDLAQATHAVAYQRCGTTLEDAREHALAAIEAERGPITAELLIAMGIKETCLTADKRSHHGTGRYCGVVQATKDKYGYSCEDLYDLELGYRAGAESIERKLATKGCKRRKNKMRCALDKYGGVSVNKSYDYSPDIFRNMKRIEDELETIRRRRARLNA